MMKEGWELLIIRAVRNSDNCVILDLSDVIELVQTVEPIV